MIPLTNAPTAITAGCRTARAAVCLLALLGWTQAGRAAAETFSNQDCLDCHSDPTTARTVAGKPVPLAVFATNAFAESVHRQLHCTDCHNTVKELVHAGGLPPAQCATCHASETAQYQGSIHGMSKARGASAAAGCADCHGAHDIVSVKTADSPVFKLNLPVTCGKCHNNPGLTSEYQMKYPQVASQYTDSIHGRALLKMGLIVAPSCNDCHGTHNIGRSVDRSSPINHANVAATCGKCHLGIEKTYNASVHGQLLARGGKNGPVCVDCHSAHQIGAPEESNFKAASDEKCGSCHADRLAHYRDTYHGKAMLLGRPNIAPEVAACYDCHGYHDVLPQRDPASHLAKGNIVATCQKCHPGANANFVKYIPHADPTDAKNYPQLHYTFVAMTALLIGVFLFFGAHTALWLFRSGYLWAHDSKTFREAKTRTQEGDEWFTRFPPFERFLHFLVVTSFLLLVLTGMPLKFYYTQWAKVIFGLLGGAEVARTLHHFGALVTFLYFGLHLAKLLRNGWLGRARFFAAKGGRAKWDLLRGSLFGPDSMIPTWQDCKDFVAHQKWFFGKGPKPQFDRWTYWEKFDYFAVFWGVFAIGVSGLVMWFPQFFSLFLPGWVINIALIVHSDEALLAAGFIFTIHFFNTHFRLEKFPMDTVIFSGRVSKTELLHERRRWYDRLLAAGRLSDMRATGDWEHWKTIARSFGYLFFGAGLVLLALIIYAMASRLAH
ncbi:MAG: cytochrome c3 family protein [Verrucomicrobiota bacterium]|jgi:cytochrome b subunit of formate dehydrogenase